jgi:hypothetical protein
MKTRRVGDDRVVDDFQISRVRDDFRDATLTISRVRDDFRRSVPESDRVASRNSSLTLLIVIETLDRA